MVSRKSKVIKRKRYGASNYKGYRGPAKRVRITAMRRYSRNARVGGFLGLELKFLDCAWNSVAINASTDGSSGEMQPSSGCTNAISVPSQGDGESQRDGRKYVIKSFWVSGVIDTTPEADQADAKEGSGCWFALVLDTQANGATIVSENVFINPATGASAMLPQPLRNLQQSTRFRILASKFIRPGNMYAMTDGASTGSLNAQNQQTFSLSWKGSINVDTSGTTADVASVTDNAVHLIAYTGSVPAKVFSGKSRMRFMG